MNMMKPFDYYSNGYPMPTKEEYTTVYVYDRGHVLWQGTPKDFIKESKNFHGNVVIQRALDKEAYNDEVARHREDELRLLNEFRDDLFHYFGVTNHPKCYTCFGLSWERSHSEGFEAVYNTFAELSQLIVD